MPLFRVDLIEEDGLVVMRIAGRLKGESVDVLAEQIPGMRPPYRVNLRDLQFADARGVELLRELRESGAELVDMPQLVSLQLEGARAGRRRWGRPRRPPG